MYILIHVYNTCTACVIFPFVSLRLYIVCIAVDRPRVVQLNVHNYKINKCLQMVVFAIGI